MNDLFKATGLTAGIMLYVVGVAVLSAGVSALIHPEWPALPSASSS